MSQFHKTCYYLQKAIRMYIDEHKSFDYTINEGGAFEKLELPFVVVMAQSSQTYIGLRGVTGNQTTSVIVTLQTGLTMTESVHWDLVAELQDMFSYQNTELCERLNGYVKELNIQKATLGALENAAQGNIRGTQIEVEFFSSINS